MGRSSRRCLAPPAVVLKQVIVEALLRNPASSEAGFFFGCRETLDKPR